jgi:hypothetical protein
VKVRLNAAGRRDARRAERRKLYASATVTGAQATTTRITFLHR